MKDKKNISIVFMGTPEFGIPAMENIHAEYGIKAAITAPDKPKGRGHKVLPSPVKIAAERLGIPVLQPEKMKDPEFLEQLHALEPDIIVIIAFRILPQEVWNCSKLGTFNIHASMLPKYRGAAPINWAIINGEERTGLTSFLLAQKVDTGNVIMQHELKIPEGATAGDLHDLMMPIAADMALETCRLLVSGEYKAYSQDHNLATPAPKIFPDFCKIKWTMHAKDLRNFIHGLSPHPGAWTMWGDKRLKILRTEFTACGVDEPGKFFIKDGNFLIHANKGIISVKELQLQGKRVMKTEEFLAGYRGETSGKFE
jgi:methionyl-tRNA formyltransferase